ncbi:MAG: hypothetical protein MPJ06_01665 [Nitrosopumilus sp.]|nr:hypothetical protein [Nitrosopumilus sp.]
MLIGADKDACHALVPGLPSCHADGGTIQGALANIGGVAHLAHMDLLK